jgi:hypothetical protein
MAKAKKAAGKPPKIKRRSFTPNIDRITDAIDAALDVLQEAQKQAKRAIDKAGKPAKGSDAFRIREANRHAMIDAKRQISALQGAKFAAESNCCSNFQDCPIDILQMAARRQR